MVWSVFVVLLCACFVAGVSGALFPPGDWYRRLSKPSWTPPDRAFPLVWTILYLCMAVAGARVAGLPGAGLALALWSLQLSLNALWTPVFFGLRRLGLGLAVLAALWVAVALTMLVLWRLDAIAGLLFAPYLVWLTVAGALNLAIWRSNPGRPD